MTWTSVFWWIYQKMFFILDGFFLDWFDWTVFFSYFEWKFESTELYWMQLFLTSSQFKKEAFSWSDSVYS